MTCSSIRLLPPAPVGGEPLEHALDLLVQLVLLILELGQVLLGEEFARRHPAGALVLRLEVELLEKDLHQPLGPVRVVPSSETM